MNATLLAKVKPPLVRTYQTFSSTPRHCSRKHLSSHISLHYQIFLLSGSYRVCMCVYNVHKYAVISPISEKLDPTYPSGTTLFLCYNKIPQKLILCSSPLPILASVHFRQTPPCPQQAPSIPAALVKALSSLSNSMWLNTEISMSPP